MLLGAIAGFVLVVVLSNTNREDTARLVTLAFLAGVAYEPIVINGLEAIGLSRSDGQALLSAEASTRVSADAVDFEELFTELNEKLEQEDTNRVAGELLTDIHRIKPQAVIGGVVHAKPIAILDHGRVA